MPLLEKPFHRYDLDVEVPATEVAVLVDAMEGERLSMKTRVGWPSLKEQLEKEQRITVQVLSDDAWPDFENDICALSRYLSEPITGRDVYVEPGEDAPFLQGWLVIGRRGETARVPLLLTWDEDANALVDRGVDKANLEPKWAELPAWVRDALGPAIRATSTTD
jgi:hypothetical protein